MAFATANPNGELRSFSMGPRKCQLLKYTAVSTDVSGTITASALSYLEDMIFSGGLRLTADPVISGNTATIAFVDPSTGGYFGTVLCIGR